MAQISLSAAAADISTNAAALAATASTITAAQYAALAELLELLGQRKGDAIPLLHLLTDTNKAELKDG